jgi:putative pyoverdin transport system ATP-binding/permease protein
MSLIKLLSRKSAVVLMIALAASLVNGLGTAALVMFLARAVSEIGHISSSAWILFALLCTILLASRVAAPLLLASVSHAAILDLRMSFIKHVLRTPLRLLEEIGHTRLQAAMVHDTSVVASGVPHIAILLAELALIVGCLVYLATLSFSGFALLLAAMFVGVFLYSVLRRRSLLSFKLSRDKWDFLLKDIDAVTKGIKELCLDAKGRELFLEENLKKHAKEYRTHSKRANALHVAATGWAQLLYFLAFGVIVFGRQGDGDAAQVTSAAFIMVLVYLLPSLQRAMESLRSLSEANSALAKVTGLGMRLGVAMARPNDTLDPPVRSQCIKLELRNVTYFYDLHVSDEHNRPMGPYSFAFNAGELTFIAGGNGSGKTTLAKLITGLYLPKTGDQFLDGARVDDDNREWYRQHFSAIFSDFHLFGSVLNKNVSDRQIQQELGRVHLGRVQVRDGAFSTTDELSQGQRKRLALVVSLLQDRPIYLFDEWAADQDPFFKDFFYKVVLPSLAMRNKIVIVITHDSHYFHLADRIIQLSEHEVATHLSPIGETVSGHTA